MRNEVLIAGNMSVDGVRIRFPRRGYDESQRRVNHVFSELARLSGWDEQAVRKYVKYGIVKSGKQGGGEWDSFFIGGQLTKSDTRPFFVANYKYVTEVHVHAYLVEKYAGAHEQFCIAFYASGGGKFTSSGYNPGPGARAKKSSGERGITIGNPKSDLHVGVRKYRGERAKVEGHYQGAGLAKARSKAARDHADSRYDGGPFDGFAALVAQASSRTANRFLTAVRSRGIVLTEYYAGVSYISWERPLHETDFDRFDQEEEVQHVMFKDVPGFFYEHQTRMDLGDEDDHA